jgi:glycopeptide antibiotics resistance protein
MLDAAVVALAGLAGAVALVAVAHLTILASVAFFPIPTDRELLRVPPGVQFWWMGVNLVPFATIGPALGRGFTGELWIAILNAFVLFPAGVYLPILFTRLRTARALVAVAIVGGASVEAIQLVISLAIGVLYRTVDVDDVILNAAGLALGLILGWLIANRWRGVA